MALITIIAVSLCFIKLSKRRQSLARDKFEFIYCLSYTTTEQFENHFQMNRQRRYTAQEALRRMLDLEEDGDDHDDEEEYLTFPNNEQPQGEGRGDEVTEEDDEDGEIQLFNDSEDSDSSSDEEIVYEADSIRYSSEPFIHHRRGRNILSEASRTLSHPSTESESFLLYIDEGMLRSVQRFTNRKAADIRRNAPRIYNWMKDFSFDAVSYTHLTLPTILLV